MTTEEMVKHIDNCCEYPEALYIIARLKAADEFEKAVILIQEDCVDQDRSELIDMINLARMKYRNAGRSKR